MLKKYLLRSVRPIGVLFIILFAVVSIFSAELLSKTNNEWLQAAFDFTLTFENRFYDYRMKKLLFEERYKNEEVALVKIDDESLSKLGVWPLSRTVYADLLKKLAEFDVKVVAFDVLFPEKSPNVGGKSPDNIFAQAIKNFQEEKRSVVLSYSIVPFEAIKEKGEVILAPTEPILEEFPVELYSNTVSSKETLGSGLTQMGISLKYPIAEFAESGANLGFISSKEDPDGLFRNYNLLANINTENSVYVDSLALISYLEWSKHKNLFAEFSKTILGDRRAGLDFGEGKLLELNEEGRTKIRYYGGDNVFESFSLYDVLHPSPSMAEKLKKNLAGRIVFVGSTAEGAHDLRPSPLDAKMPGVYAHINMAHMLIHKYFFRKVDDSIKLSLLILFLGAAIFLLVHRLDNAFVDILTLIGLLTAISFADSYYFIREGYELKLFYCYFCFVTIYSWNTFLNFYQANKEKRQIRGTFARYVAPTVVEEMLKDPDHIVVGGAKMDISCLFSDVRDFTSISEGLSAQDLANALNQYMTVMTDIVFDTKGTLDKYIGDAIVAIWGAPISIGNHAEFAVTAAIRMAEAMPAINADFASRGYPEFLIGIGINTGECSVGNMGSTRIFSYTALGDNMNLGARLEGLCKYYGAQILISENTLARLKPESVKTRPIDKVIVKGRQQAVQIFEVISKVHFMDSDSDLHQFYMTGWLFFTNKNFQGAHDVFAQILTKEPRDKASKRLKQLCEKYLANPELVTEDFDVTKMTEK